jgi:hypothetical protein
MSNGGTYSFDGAEAWLSATARDELPAMIVARNSSEALAAAMNGASVPAAKDPAPPSYYASVALLQLAAIGLRTARAAMLVVAAGYEPETHALKRRLSESHARAQAVVADQSGQHAREWLEGKGPSSPLRITKKFGSAELFEMYSESAHATSTGLAWWLLVPVDDEAAETGILLQPHRRPAFANALLTEIAMECRDFANIVVKLRGGELAGLDDLTTKIDDAIEKYYVAEKAE